MSQLTRHCIGESRIIAESSLKTAGYFRFSDFVRATPGVEVVADGVTEYAMLAQK